jgi:hypothetical protein
MGAVRFSASTGALALLCVAGVAGMLSLLTGCGVDCEQDFPPPEQITTNDNPHRISYLSSDLGIASIRWQNVTTGASGTGSVTRVNECTGGFPFPRICGDWSRIIVDVSLAPGQNTVHTFESSDGCEWREDYLITLN